MCSEDNQRTDFHPQKIELAGRDEPQDKAKNQAYKFGCKHFLDSEFNFFENARTNILDRERDSFLSLVFVDTCVLCHSMCSDKSKLANRTQPSYALHRLNCS